jgi:hypothetical protein
MASKSGNHSPTTLMDARNAARDALIGYLCDPPVIHEAKLRFAMKALAHELDVSYEDAWRSLLVGSVKK